MVYSKRKADPHEIVRSLKEGQRIEKWMRTLGIFEMELSGHMMESGDGRDTQGILRYANATKAHSAGNMLFGSGSFVQYTQGFDMKNMIYFLGWQKGIPGVARLVHEALEKKVPLPSPRLLEIASRNPEGFKPKDYDFTASTIWNQVRALESRKVLRTSRHEGKVYPTDICMDIFSEETISSFKELKEMWKDYKVPVFREQA